MRLVLPSSWLLAMTLPNLLSVVVVAKNMNSGGPYLVSNSESYNTEYPDDLEYFDVYSNPIKTLYSQVHWISHGNIPLPEHIVKRFASPENSVMAMTGYEVDQVRIDPKTGKEIPVPISWSYNHHYCAWVFNSKTSKLVQKKATTPELQQRSHGEEYVWTVDPIEEERLAVEDDDTPHRQFISEGNGGEMRKSYHGYPKGYAQLIRSPDMFTVTPMQIDTWDRDRMTNGTFVPGAPLPNSFHPIDPVVAGYNPLLECPCTDRLEKKWGMTYTLDPNACTNPIASAEECFKAAPALIPAIKVETRKATTPDLPPGCSGSLGENGMLDVVWNEQDKVFSEGTTPHVVGVATGVVNITIVLPLDDDVKGNNDDKTVGFTLQGPANKWFGVGFGTDSMCLHMEADECPMGGPYALVVMGDTIQERKLAFHGEGEVLKSSLNVVSNIVEDGIRTVKISRSVCGASESYYTFDPSKPSLDVIMATGCGLEFKQHCGHGPNTINFVAVDKPTAVCQAGIEGTIGGRKFHKDCQPFPTGDLLHQHNPACSIQDYQGGLPCCGHNNFLLDKDQEVPWSDQPLEFRLKFRFYFEDYEPALQTTGIQSQPSHQNLYRFYFQTEARAGEYDVTKCPDGTPPSQCIHQITSRWKVSDFESDFASGDADSRVELIYAGPHCHAPMCLSMELYNYDTGSLLCHMEPIRGTGKSHDPYDEHHYLSIPPCLWSHDSPDLATPQTLHMNTTLLSIKRANATFPHTGEMASWQMRGVVLPKASSDKSSEKAHPNLRSHATAPERDQI